MKKRTKRSLIVLMCVIVLPVVLLIGSWVPTTLYHKSIINAIQNYERPLSFMSPKQYEYNGIKSEVARYRIDDNNYIYIFLDDANYLIVSHLKVQNEKYKMKMLIRFDKSSFLEKDTNVNHLMDFNGYSYACDFYPEAEELSNAYYIEEWEYYIVLEIQG